MAPLFPAGTLWLHKRTIFSWRGGGVFGRLPSEILFFWKLVSHGGLDFSISVSSTI